MKVSIGKYPKKGKRKSSIKIHSYDVWSLDHTLAIIILPALKLLAKQKQGIPGSMLCERYNQLSGQKLNAKEKREYNKLWKACEKRWKDVIDAMIWSFEEIVNDDDGEAYFKGNSYTTDQYKEYCDKVQKGLSLFGEHYQSLWT